MRWPAAFAVFGSRRFASAQVGLRGEHVGHALTALQAPGLHPKASSQAVCSDLAILRSRGALPYLVTSPRSAPSITHVLALQQRCFWGDDAWDGCYDVSCSASCC